MEEEGLMDVVGEGKKEKEAVDRRGEGRMGKRSFQELL